MGGLAWLCAAPAGMMTVGAASADAAECDASPPPVGVSWMLSPLSLKASQHRASRARHPLSGVGARRGSSGRHGAPDILLLAPPGAGTSRLARRLTTILPICPWPTPSAPRIPRMAGRTCGRTALATTRPCRAPRHPISAVGLIGGGQVPLAGRSPYPVSSNNSVYS